MATYYVNASSGDDTQAGTSAATAWATLDYATAMLSAGDVLIVTSPATEPFRNGMAPAVAGTYRGTTANERAYITGLVNVSHGTTIPNLIKNGDLEAWIDAAEAWAVQQSGGDPIARSMDVHGGTYSMNATKVGTNIYLGIYAYLPANTNMDFVYWHKDSVAGRWQFNIQETDPVPNNYLQADGSWAAAAHNFDPNDFNANWHSYTKNFTTNGAGPYVFVMQQKFAETVYLDDVSLSYNGAATYQWSDVVGQNYKVLNIPFPLEPTILAKSTVAAWTSLGIEALEWATQAANLVALDSAPGQWYYDAATDLVYYCPETGEDVTALHIELTQPRLSEQATLPTGLVSLSVANISLRNLHIMYSNTYGLWAGAGGSDISLHDIDCIYTDATAVWIAGGETVHAYRCKASYGEEGFFISGAGSYLIADQCIADYAYDDGFQAGASAGMTLTRCVSRGNGRELVGDNSGFSIEGNGAVGVLYNCTAYGNYGYGISHAGTGAGSCTIRNCIAYRTVSSAANDVYVAAVHSTLTHDHNIFGGHGGAWVVGATEQETNPLFMQSCCDLRLSRNSPAIDAGVDVGLEYNGDAPDCGAYEYVPRTPNCCCDWHYGPQAAPVRRPRCQM